MKVAVITPYFREPLETLRQCHQSVVNQTHPCTHFMIADGFPSRELDSWPIQHIVLAKSHADVGNTPRSIGSLSAMNQEFDAIAFLDADNLYLSNHIESMVNLYQQTHTPVCIASRTINRLDGSIMLPHGRPSDGTEHVDTSCYFFTPQAFRLLPLWAAMPTELGACGDQVIWLIIQKLNIPHAQHSTPTVAFRTQYAFDYEAAGESPPPNAKTAQDSYIAAMKWWTDLPAEKRDEFERRMWLRR